jgi:hypothetical protein
MDLSVAPANYVEITPGSVAQVMRSRKGYNILIEDDVQGIANQLQEISEEFRLVYNANEALWMLEQHKSLPDGSVKEDFVSSFTECDHRILHRAREVSAPGYDLGAELEKAERQADAEMDHKRREVAGDLAEKLGHALRADLSRHEAPTTRKSHAYVPGAFRPRG